FVLYSNNDGIDPRELNVPYEKRPELDRWILSRYNRLVKEVTEEMDRYDHMKTVRKIQDFVNEDLSNWYIRRARRRFWAEELTEDKASVYQTTYEVFVGVTKLAAPFAPFITDEMYTKLTGEYSVHLALYPEANEALLDDAVEERMDIVRNTVSLGRGVREKERLKVRQPLQAILVDGKYEAIVGDMVDLIEEELNVKEVRFEKDLTTYMNYGLKPNFKVAGPALGAKIKSFGKAIAQADPAAVVSALEADGKVELAVDGETLTVEKDWVDVQISAKEGFAVAMENNLFVVLDTAITPELIAEGLSREMISKLQQMRKQKGFEMMDNIRIFYSADEDVKKALEVHGPWIMKETLAVEMVEKEGLEEYDLNGHKTGLDVERV
ncbi:MAG: isoleucine--tRNA ligase, partial [Clostridiales bacterium]|nr:isoleucine--tRNA ligase [Clostridiales bacterium]